MKNFAITGVAGFIAPRHLQAIKDTGNQLVAALDPHDSVGILDRFAMDVEFFTEYERFDRRLEMLRRQSSERRVDYLSICSPNYLHDAHIRLALRIGADAICEKPLVLNPWNLDALEELERETGKRLFTILQLRAHPALMKLKQETMISPPARKREIILTYVTARGSWYLYSWKGSMERSGGLASNIGIHFFDFLLWVFGKCTKSEMYLNEPTRMSGYLELEHAVVQWFLSINDADLPRQAIQAQKRTYRSITLDGTEIEFSDGFTDLHTQVYRNTLEGKGFGISDARASIELVHQIRTATITAARSNPHPFLQQAKTL
jgi:UDP-N-acetyl-2-amino-2-deoxyglucuronate dehydrogenase